MKTSLFLLFTVLCSMGFSQQPKPLVNSGEVLKKGATLLDAGKYKDAIAGYKTVSRSDTNYVKVLLHLSETCYKDSQYDASLAYAKEGEKLFPSNEDDWLNLMANALNAQEKTEEALVIYDKIIALNPFNYLAPYNKGIAYYQHKRYKEAKPYFEHAALLNPYFSKVHFYLGRVALEDGNLVAAALSFTTNLALNPDNSLAQTSAINLNNIANTKDEVVTSTNGYKAGAEDNFDLLQDIILSKAALDKKYKLKTEVEDPICRQLQAILEKLTYNKDDKGFWMQYYVPFYTKLFAEGKFNLLTNFMFSGFKIKVVDDFVRRNKKEIDAYEYYESNYFNGIKETHILNYQDRGNAKVHYYVEDGTIAGKGEWTDVNGKKKLFGPWEFYHENGKIKSKGELNSDGKKTGPWEFYYNNGILSEKTTYVNNEAEGKCTIWFDNGNLSSERNYKHGLFDGEVKYYFYNGLIRSVQNYKEGKQNGVQKSYKSTGELDFVLHFTNGVQDQDATYYHLNGKIASVTQAKDNKAEGSYKKFDEKGTLILQGSYVNDKRSGDWKSFFSSGKLKSNYTYIDGLLEGEYKEYFENGKLNEQSNYKKGKQDGDDICYNEDGKLYIQSRYEKGRLRELKYYDKTGKEIYSATTRNGAGNFIYYDASGNKTYEGFLTKDGDKDGKTTYYYKNGKISEVDMFKKGSQEGEKTTYYRTGALHEKTTYSDNQENGYYTSLHENGNLRYTGWMVNDNKQGEHQEYNVLGGIVNNANYRNNSLDGYYEFYNCNGKKYEEQLYDEGWVKHITQFDSTGKAVVEMSIVDGNADIAYKYANGKVSVQGTYKHFYLNGPYKVYYFDGSLFYESNYVNGRREGAFKSYFYGNIPESEGNYKAGDKDGLWRYYHPNGKLSYEETYVDGKEQGKLIVYNQDGKEDREMNYKDGMLEGEYKILGENGELGILINYKADALISYTYEGKDGKLLPAIPLKNGTGVEKAYYKNGNKSVEIQVEDNTVNGIRNLYFTNGKPYVEGSRVFGKDNDVRKVYYLSGQLRTEEHYVVDEKNGVCKNWYENGTLKSEESYVADSLYGECKYYDEKGKLKETRTYYCGTLINVKRP